MKIIFDKSKREINITALLSVYYIYMLIFFIYSNSNTLITIMIATMMVMNWFFTLNKNFDYEGRAIISSILINISYFLYVFTFQNVNNLMIPFITTIIILSLYDNVKVFHVCYINWIGILIYYIFIIYKNSFFDYSASHTIASFFNSLVAIIICQFFTHKRNQTRENYDKVIEELNEAKDSKDDFLSNISHEIRTPVNTISGMSVIMLNENIPFNIRDSILSIQSANKDLISVVTDILDFSELQTDHIEIIEKPFNITSTINDVVSTMNAWRFEKKDIEFIIDIDSKVPSVLIGDERKLKRVLVNLLDNAFKFTESGAVVLKISSRKEEYGINLNVSILDTGIGINDKDKEYILNKFNQLDTSRSRAKEGLGLGLAISQYIVDAFGGFLTINSNPGKGSEFKFVIPQKVENFDSIAAVSNAKSYEILLYISLEHFEDPFVRTSYAELLENMLHYFDFEYHICRSFEELKRRAQNSSVTHIIVSDFDYDQQKSYYNEQAETKPVILLLDDTYEANVTSEKIIKFFKPFYIIPFASILNGDIASDRSIGHSSSHKRFIAPDAKILVVDDNKMNLKVMSKLLLQYGIKSTLCISGRKALDEIKTKEYDCIFMDHMMPEMDGIDTLKAIRRLEGRYFEEVPIVAVTANAVAGAKEMFFENGFQGFIAKPVEMTELNSTLKAILPENKIIYDTIDFYEKKPEEIVEQDLIAVSDSKEQNKDTVSESPTQISLKDIDVAQGIQYCGTYNDYLDILQMNVENSKQTVFDLNQAFEKEDWSNYTILIHAVKSSMKMIGAMTISNIAKELEMQSKQGNAAFIKANHEIAIDEYNLVISKIDKGLSEIGIKVKIEEVSDCTQGSADELGNDVQDLNPDISSELLNELQKSFEDAIYTFDETSINKALSEIEKYSYHGKNLASLTKKVHSCIDMSDFMTAYDQLKNIIEEM